MYWKLAIWKLCFGALKVAGTGYVSATAAVKWSSMTKDERILVLLMIAMAVGTFVDGFLDRTVARLIAGKPPVIPGEANGGGTEITIKTP